MKDIIKFLDLHYENALKLVSDFDSTKKKKWNSQIYLNELFVQVGHVYNVLFSNSNVNETNRKIDNLGDELSDVLLQIINLAKVLDIDMYEIKNYSNYDYSEINGITILLGQLTEAIMENNDYRFKKDRIGFNSNYDFIKDRIFKIFIITFQISKKYNLDMIKEFNEMLEDANNFLNKFKNTNKKRNMRNANKLMNSKIRKIYNYTYKQKKQHPNNYYFDDGKVCKVRDFEKDNVKYSIMKVNTDIKTKNYLVYLLIISKNKSIPQLLVKNFKSEHGTVKYFNELCSLVESNNNKDIIDKCYNNIFGI